MRNEIPCYMCGGEMKYHGAGHLECEYGDMAFFLQPHTIERINEMIQSERSEVSSAFFHAAYHINQTTSIADVVPISTHFSIDALALIAFDLMAIEQVESGENDQNV